MRLAATGPEQQPPSLAKGGRAPPVLMPASVAGVAATVPTMAQMHNDHASNEQ